MSSHSTSQAEPAKIEQIINEFFVKTLHIIVDSRIPSSSSHNGDYSMVSSSISSSSSGLRSRDKWFNLALGECPASFENMELWRRSMSGPMIVDVILLRASDTGDENSSVLPKKHSFKGGHLNYLNAGEESPQEVLDVELILERWIVQYEYRKPSTRDIPFARTSVGSGISRREDGKKAGSNVGLGKGRGLLGTGESEPGVGSTQISSHAVDVPVAYKKTYKRTVILLRSLYCTCRLLPAYRLFRHENSSSHNSNFTIAYRVSFSPDPLSAVDEAEMHPHNFTPVETPCGRLCLSVLYRPIAADASLEASVPLQPWIITDYVRSPSADPPQRFPGDTTVTSGKKEVPTTSLLSSAPGSPTCPAFVRRHNWNGSLRKVLPSPQSPLSPAHRPSVSPSPSPSYSYGPGSPSTVPASYPDAYQQYMQVDLSLSPSSSPMDRLHTRTSSCQSHCHQKAASFDEHWLLPPFSPSPSPSPPPHFPEGNHLDRFAHSGTAPVSIPVPSVVRSPRNWAAECHNQNRLSLPPPSPKSRKPDALSRTASANSRIVSAQSPVYQGYLSEWRSSRKGDASRPAECQTGITTFNAYSGQKMSKDGNDDIQLPGIKFSSSGSPRFPFSRSSSKLSYQDDIEDEEFSYPFAVYDDEMSECRSRTNSIDGRQSISESPETVGQILTTPRKSQGAAVGALVHLLKSAPPLRPEFCDSYDSLQTYVQPQSITDRGVPALSVTRSHSVMDGSGLFVHKTAADALEELRSYRKMKDDLFSQSGTSSGEASQHLR